MNTKVYHPLIIGVFCTIMLMGAFCSIATYVVAVHCMQLLEQQTLDDDSTDEIAPNQST